MIILFATDDLRKLLNLEGRMVRRMGAQKRKKIKVRMAQLAACQCLEDMRAFPAARLEELRHKPDQHIFTVRIDNPDRIVFEPADDPVPLHPGGNVDWTRVKVIRILEVGDPHGK